MPRVFYLSKTIWVLGLLAACLQGCGDRTSTQGVSGVDGVSESAQQNEVEGVDWRTDPEAALEEARSSDRAVILYFTAEWCPPCHELKAHVFSQPSFIEKSRLFVPVYLDFDQPQTQSWSEEWGVVGFPTLVVLDQDGTEIQRISGGMNLAAYEEVLETALSETQPIDVLLGGLDDADDLTPASCRRLAYHEWSLNSDYSELESEIGAKLLLAGQHCPAEAPVVRARLRLVAATLLAPASAAALTAGDEIDPTMWQALEGVYEISQDPALADPNALIIASAPQEYHSLAHRYAEAKGVDAVTPWLESLARFAENPENTSFTRLLAIGGRLALLSDADGDDSLPEVDVVAAREAVAELLGEEPDGYGRSALLLPAVRTLKILGDYDVAQNLLLEEIPKSKTPYYPMSSLAGLLEETGDNEQALEWFEKAYDNAEGRMTRLAWGYRYARARIRLDPDDSDRIVTTAVRVINEIRGVDWSSDVQSIMGAMETALEEWNANGEHEDALAEIRSAILEVCDDVDGESSTRCQAFLAPAA